jgi:hypothetical protein
LPLQTDTQGVSLQVCAAGWLLCVLMDGKCECTSAVVGVSACVGNSSESSNSTRTSSTYHNVTLRACVAVAAAPPCSCVPCQLHLP